MPSSKSPKSVRNKVTERANRRCEYCCAYLDYSPDPFTVEHIIPRSQSGPDTLKNLALACFGCNNAKYNRSVGFDDVTQQQAALYNPRSDVWSEHFSWNDFEIEALSATGRVTSNMLKLNRTPLINLRRLLATVGLHPPSD